MYTSITSRIPSSPVRNRGSLAAAAFKMNGSTAMSVNRDGSTYFKDLGGSPPIPTIKLGYSSSLTTQNGIANLGLYNIGFWLGSRFAITLGFAGGGLAGVNLLSQLAYSWTSSTTTATTAPDLLLWRDAAGTLAQYNSTNAQSYRIYNTNVGSNYERAALSWSSNEFLIGIENGGTGVARNLKFQTSATTRMGITSVGNVYIGTSSAALSTAATDGFFYIPTCAGTPTGTPTAITGAAPMVADSTNSKVYCYLGGAWVALN